MRTTPIALTSLVAGLALAAAAAAQTPGPAASPPGDKAATPTLPGAATTARENSQGPAHASDTGKDNASPNSAIAPAPGTDASATAAAPVADDAAPATDPKAKPKKKAPTDPAHGVSPLTPH
jgi:hypothetical protein